jgi:hypothetical protein
MYRSKTGTPHNPGQARFANAVYTYKPDFASGDYREGIVSEDDRQVTFEFSTPYIIAAMPPNAKAWGIYDPGCSNGLVLHGKAECDVALSVDCGKSWENCGKFRDGLDLTDHVKGRRQYQIRFQTSAKQLAGSGLTMTTVCQANSSVLPRLKDNGSEVRFAASGRAVASAGPNLPQAQAHVVDGKFDSPRVTLALSAPHSEPVVALYAAAHIRSSNPPRPEIKYQIEASTDGGKSWRPVVKDWRIVRRGDEPKDFWSQSMCWGTLEFPKGDVSKVLVRFRNDGGKQYARCEAHLVYRTPGKDATKVTFAWNEDSGPQQASHVFPAGQDAEKTVWRLPTGRNVRTRWVEFALAPPK